MVLLLVLVVEAIIQVLREVVTFTSESVCVGDALGAAWEQRCGYPVLIFQSRFVCEISFIFFFTKIYIKFNEKVSVSQLVERTDTYGSKCYVLLQSNICFCILYRQMLTEKRELHYYYSTSVLLSFFFLFGNTN